MYSNSVSVESGLIDCYAWDTVVNWMESKNSGIALDSTNYGNYMNSSITLTNVLYRIYIHDSINGKWISFPVKYKKGDLNILPRVQGGESTFYEIATGSTEKIKVLNIYDMAGNMWEWTTEVGNHNAGASATQYAVARGGGLDGYGDKYPVSSCSGNVRSEGCSYDIGFRVVLYVK